MPVYKHFIKYHHSDWAWSTKVKRLEGKIAKVHDCLAQHIFCDKWGEPLEVGDRVQCTKHREIIEATIIEISGQAAVLSDGSRIHWSYLVKKGCLK